MDGIPTIFCVHKLSKTYCAQLKAGHEKMTIGVEYFCNSSEYRLDRLLLQPFRKAG